MPSPPPTLAIRRGLILLTVLAMGAGEASAQVGQESSGGAPRAVEKKLPTPPESGPTSATPRPGTSAPPPNPDRVRSLFSASAAQRWQHWWWRNLSAYEERVLEPRPSTPSFLLDPLRRKKSLDRQRGEVLAALDRGLDDANAAIRAACTIARAQASTPGDHRWEERLRKALRDPSSTVRNSATLAAAISPASAVRYDLLNLLRGNYQAFPRATTSDERRRLRAWTAVFLALGGQTPPNTLLELELKNPRVSDSQRVLWMLSAGLVGDARHVDLLLHFAKERHRHELVRCAAIEALPGSQWEKTVPTLLQILANPRNPPEVRVAAARGLGRSPVTDRSVTQALERSFRRDSSEVVRGFSLIALGQLGGATAETTLTHALMRGRGEEPAFAALGLGFAARNGSGPATLNLIQQLPKQNRLPTRRAVVLGLGLSRDDRALPSLLNALQDRNPDVRRTACEAMSVHGAALCLPILVDCLREDPVPSVRSAAAEAYGQLDPLATLTLQPCLVDGSCTTSESRRPILRALGESGDPQAIPLLLEEWGRKGATGSARQAAATALGALYRPSTASPTDAVGHRSNHPLESPDIRAILKLGR